MTAKTKTKLIEAESEFTTPVLIDELFKRLSVDSVSLKLLHLLEAADGWERNDRFTYPGPIYLELMAEVCDHFANWSGPHSWHPMRAGFRRMAQIARIANERAK